MLRDHIYLKSAAVSDGQSGLSTKGLALRVGPDPKAADYFQIWITKDCVPHASEKRMQEESFLATLVHEILHVFLWCTYARANLAKL